MKYRPRLNEEEYALITNHRALQKECELQGIPMNDVNHYWHKGKHFSLHVKNKGVSPEELKRRHHKGDGQALAYLPKN